MGRTVYDNLKSAPVILGLGSASAVGYGILALLGDLTTRIPVFYGLYAGLAAGMLLAWHRTRDTGSRIPPILLFALIFRVVAALGEPALSDDVYRYVWDGRVQWAGVHPYAMAPDDPRLDSLRDDDWTRINHPELRTIYPPAAQVAFAALAGVGAGPTGFRLALGLVDFAVVWLAWGLLRRARLPVSRLVLYAWNPVVILESAGSGHLEPLGVALLLLAVIALASSRAALLRGGAWLGLAIQTKLLPLVLFAPWWRRLGVRGVAVAVLVVLAIHAPYALTGPALGSGTFDYADRWERNSLAFSSIRSALDVLDVASPLKRGIAAAQSRIGGDTIPWSTLYEHVWPGDVARAIVGGLAVAWLLWVAWRFRRIAEGESDVVALCRGALWALGGVLLLAPTLHPWYALWVLPFAVVLGSRVWILFVGLLPLAYVTSVGDVPWWARAIEYGVPSIFGLVGCLRVRRRSR